MLPPAVTESLGSTRCHDSVGEAGGLRGGDGARGEQARIRSVQHGCRHRRRVRPGRAAVGYRARLPWPVGGPVRHQRRRRWSWSTPVGCRSRRTARPSCWPRPSQAGPAARHHGPASVGSAEHVIVVVGTPVDEHLNPDLGAVPAGDRSAAREYLRDGQLIVLRSTVHPGVTALTEKLLSELGARGRRGVLPGADRRGQGDDRAVRPAADRRRPRPTQAADRAEKLFRNLTEQIVRLEPEEAELAKLFTNTWRYIKFAAANQFWMMANDSGLDFERIRHAIRLRLPAGGRHAGRRLRRRPVPAQGHHAAGRVQQQQLRARPLARC